MLSCFSVFYRVFSLCSRDIPLYRVVFGKSKKHPWTFQMAPFSWNASATLTGTQPWPRTQHPQPFHIVAVPVRLAPSPPASRAPSCRVPEHPPPHGRSSLLTSCANLFTIEPSSWKCPQTAAWSFAATWSRQMTPVRCPGASILLRSFTI